MNGNNRESPPDGRIGMQRPKKIEDTKKIYAGSRGVLVHGISDSVWYGMGRFGADFFALIFGHQFFGPDFLAPKCVVTFRGKVLYALFCSSSTLQVELIYGNGRIYCLKKNK